MQHSEMGRLKNPHNCPYSPLHICSITKAPALVRLPKTTWIRISWVILRNCLLSFFETNWFYIQSLGGGAKTKTKTPYPLAFLLLKESVRRMARRLHSSIKSSRNSTRSGLSSPGDQCSSARPKSQAGRIPCASCASTMGKEVSYNAPLWSLKPPETS